MKKSKKLLILIISMLLLCGCKAKYTSKIQFSDLIYDDEYIVGHVKNLTENKYKLKISFELKNGGIKENDTCEVNLNPKETKKIKCFAYLDEVNYEVKVKDVDFKQIPTFEEKNFKNGDSLTEEELKDYFEEALEKHILFNSSLLFDSDVSVYPFIKNITYKNDKVQIFNVAEYGDVSFDSLEYYDKDGSFSGVYITIHYTTPDELDTFITKLSLSVNLIDDMLDYSDVDTYMKEAIEDDKCYKVYGYCMAQHNAGVDENNKLKKTFYIEKQ